MISTVSEILGVLSQLFGPETAASACSSGFCQRRSKLSGQAFVQGLVFGWLNDPQARVCDLAAAVACAGVAISPQALQQRFNARSAALLQTVIASAVKLELMSAGAGSTVSTVSTVDCQKLTLPGRFSRVWVQDSTTISLPGELSAQWPGGSGEAALKVEVRLELQSGVLGAPLLVPGRFHDLKAATGHPDPQPNELQIADLGYFDLKRLLDIDQKGGFFLSRLKVGTLV